MFLKPTCLRRQRHLRPVDVSSIKAGRALVSLAFTESDKHGGHRWPTSWSPFRAARRVLFPAEPVTGRRARKVAREVVALAIGAEPEA